MLTLLSMALAGEEVPDALPLSVSLMPPETQGTVTTLIAVLHNPNPTLRVLSITPATLRITAGDTELSPQWSVQSAEVRPGERLAIFGRVSLSPGPQTLRAWLHEDGAAAAQREADAELNVEIDVG